MSGVLEPKPVSLEEAIDDASYLADTLGLLNKIARQPGYVRQEGDTTKILQIREKLTTYLRSTEYHSPAYIAAGALFPSDPYLKGTLLRERLAAVSEVFSDIEPNKQGIVKKYQLVTDVGHLYKLSDKAQAAEGLLEKIFDDENEVELIRKHAGSQLGYSSLNIAMTLHPYWTVAKITIGAFIAAGSAIVGIYLWREFY